VIILDIPQRTPAWFAARLGRLTGSVAADMLATIKSGEAAARRNLRTRLVVERLTGQPQDDGFVTAAMQRGVETEPKAFAAYEAITGLMARPVGFIQHPTVLAGCSPDGLVGDDGVLELKCPNTATHIGYLRSKGLPADYVPQVTHNLWVTGAAYCDFVSFDDRLPAALQVFHVRVTAGELDIQAYEKKALAFLAEVDAEVAALQTMADTRGTLARAVEAVA
jgi:hypothetical protein